MLLILTVAGVRHEGTPEGKIALRDGELWR